MPANYTSLLSGEAAPAKDGVAVTPSDTLDIPGGPCRALWVGGAGNVRVTTVGGTQLTFSGVPAGTMLPVGASRVWAAGTTATLIVGVW